MTEGYAACYGAWHSPEPFGWVCGDITGLNPCSAPVRLDFEPAYVFLCSDKSLTPAVEVMYMYIGMAAIFGFSGVRLKSAAVHFELRRVRSGC